MPSPSTITKIEFFRAKSTRSVPIADATHQISDISFVITRITLASGVTGEAYLLSFHFSPNAIAGALKDVREIALGLVRENLAARFRDKERMTYEQFLEVIDDQKQGALRVSIGLATNFSDVYQFLQFAQTFINRRASSANNETVQVHETLPAGETVQMDETMNESATLIAPLGKKHFVVRMCACGYQDNRLNKGFCPHCGRPMPMPTQSTLQPEASQVGQRQERTEGQQ